MQHWYPEGYVDPWTPPQTPTPVWKNNFKSYYDVPSNNTKGSSQPTTSQSTGQLLSSGTSPNTNPPSSYQSLPRNTQNARVFSSGSASASGSPLARGTAPASNYQRVQNTASSKLSPQGKSDHSSTVVSASPLSLMSPSERGLVEKNFYNTNVAPTSQKLPKVDTTHGPSSVCTSASAKSKEPAILESPPWNGVSDFVDGSTYFKIGEYVYIRRWHADAKVYTPWLPGKVVRPDFCKAPDGREERRYVVSYQDLMTGTQKEKTYSPSLKEIREIPGHFGMPTASVASTHSVVSANANMQTSGTIVRRDSTVFALLQITNGDKPYSVWTPSAIEKPHGYRVRAIAGPFKNQEFCKVLEVMPYNAEIAKDLRHAGNRVEKSAIDVGY